MLLVLDEHTAWENYDPEKSALYVRRLYGDTSAKPPRERAACAPEAPPHSPTREDLGSLDPLNRAFLQGAQEYGYEWSLGNWVRHGPIPWNPNTLALYRSIEGHDHTLLVLDLDGPTLQATWKATQHLSKTYAWAWVKMSGSRGFHLIARLPGEVAPDALRDLAHDALHGAGYETGPGRSKFTARRGTHEVQVDGTLFHARHMIRAYSRNWKSGLMSVPVYPWDTLETVLARSATW